MEKNLNKLMIMGVAFLGQAKSGADEFSGDLKTRAYEKWERSKLLPRKAKKLMRKDALLDFQISEWTDDFSNELWNF